MLGKTRVTRVAPLLVLACVAACAGRRSSPADATVTPPPASGFPSPASPPRAAAAARPDPFGDLLIDPGACDLPVRAEIAREDALVDVAVVERVLGRGYAGFDVLAEQGLDWNQVFAGARAEIAAWPLRFPTTLLRDALVRWLRPARDNHLAIFDHARFYASTGVRERAHVVDLTLERRGDALVVTGGADAGARLVGCEGHSLDGLLGRFVDETLRVSVRPVVLAATTPPPLRCQLVGRDGAQVERKLTFRRFRWPADEPSKVTYERLGGRVPRLRVRDLGGDREVDLAWMVADARALRDAPAIVLDVRGNDGGADNAVRDWFAGLTKGELRYNTIDELSSEVTAQGTLNMVTCDEVRAGKTASWAEGLRARAAERLARGRREGLFRRTERYTPVIAGKADRPYAGPVVLLTDSSCGSSCESFVLYTRQLPGGLVIGQNTAGVGVFGEARSYRLPRSGLGLQAGTKWFHNADPRLAAKEGRGHLPDLWIDSENAPLIAENVAVCLLDPACAPRLRRP